MAEPDATQAFEIDAGEIEATADDTDGLYAIQSPPPVEGTQAFEVQSPAGASPGVDEDAELSGAAEADDTEENDANVSSTQAFDVGISETQAFDPDTSGNLDEDGFAVPAPVQSPGGSPGSPDVNETQAFTVDESIDELDTSGEIEDQDQLEIPETQEFSVGTQEFSVETQEFSVGTQEFSVGTQEFSVETQEFSVETQGFSVGTQEFSVETQESSAETQEFSAEDAELAKSSEQDVPASPAKSDSEAGEAENEEPAATQRFAPESPLADEENADAPASPAKSDSENSDAGQAGDEEPAATQRFAPESPHADDENADDNLAQLTNETQRFSTGGLEGENSEAEHSDTENENLAEPAQPGLDTSFDPDTEPTTSDFHIPSEDQLESALPTSPDEMIQNLESLEGAEAGTTTEGQARELLSDIFDGESDEEGFAGFEAEEVEKAKETGEAESAALSDAEEEIRAQRQEVPEDFEYDFEKMMRLKKEQVRRSKRRRKRGDVEFISDYDEVIEVLRNRMQDAAKEDRKSNENQKPGLKKRKMLGTVLGILRKRDMQDPLIENGILTAMADWLSPLPDHSLPTYEIRTEFIKILESFPTPEPEMLKSSNIGKSVMTLCKHPKETKDNRKRAWKLINTWSRQVFDIKSDYAALSKEDREQRDYEHMTDAKKRRLSSDAKPPSVDQPEEEAVLRPGDKGWIGRARVPRASTRDYVVRPKWNVEGPVVKEKRKKTASFMEKKLREFKDRTKTNKAMRATSISISGNKMK